jgi:hypothetical protein
MADEIVQQRSAPLSMTEQKVGYSIERAFRRLKHDTVEVGCFECCGAGEFRRDRETRHSEKNAKDSQSSFVKTKIDCVFPPSFAEK